MYHIEVSGTPYEMGVQQGSQLKPLIHALVGEWTTCHSHELPSSERKRFIDERIATVQDVAPELLEELKGISDGSAVHFEDLASMNFRIWYEIGKWRKGGCSNIGFQFTKRGVLLGGTLDDPRYPYYLLSSSPKSGYRHICVSWAGTVWGGRGMNEVGLAIGLSSAGCPGVKTSQPLLGRPFFPDFLARLILMRCATAEDVVEFARGFSLSCNLMVADPSGELLLLELTPWMQRIRRPKDGALYCSNHFNHPDIVSFMRENGYWGQDHSNLWSNYRYWYLEKVARENKDKYSFELLKKILTSHENFPSSVCHNGTACTTIAVPLEKRLYVADRYACCNRPWKEYIF